MSFGRVAGLWLFSGVIVLLASGCSGQEPGTPIATETGGARDGRDVPQVVNPLDMSAYLDNPCGLVPQKMVSRLGYVDPGEPDTGKTSSSAKLSGPGCSWTAPDSIKAVDINIQTGNRKNELGGLQGLFDAYERGQYVYWESTTVTGYPAAYNDAVDLRDSGVCSLSIGIADDLTFSVTAAGYTDQPNQACTDAEQVAEQVIATLKGGS